MDATRQRLINETERLLGEIKQLYVDGDYWNNTTRVNLYPGENPIDIDPTGELAQLERSLEASLRHEAALGNFPNHAPDEEDGQEECGRP